MVVLVLILNGIIIQIYLNFFYLRSVRVTALLLRKQKLFPLLLAPYLVFDVTEMIVATVIFGRFSLLHRIPLGLYLVKMERQINLIRFRFFLTIFISSVYFLLIVHYVDHIISLEILEIVILNILIPGSLRIIHVYFFARRC